MPPLQLGCLGAEGTREVFVCQSGNRRFLEIRSGRGGAEGISEIPLEKEQFEKLWKLTTGSRVSKILTTCYIDGADFTLETIDCGRGSLSIAVGRFTSRGSAAAFQPPPGFGSEITGLAEYSDSHLALHGIPPLRNGAIQAGAMPFLFKNGILHIVLVTSSSGTRWIVPKGGLEAHLTRQEAALMEAAEEAGAIGTIEQGIQTRCRMADQRELDLYALRVSTLLPNWPERPVRRRVVLPIYRALLRVRDPGLAEAIRRLSRMIDP